MLLLLLLSVIGGLDLDLDIGGGDVDVDAGGLGLIKGVLTFISVSSWVIKVLIATGQHPGIAIGFGIFCGICAFLILNFLLVFLMRGQSYVNYSLQDALFQEGKVYLKIPAAEGDGIVQINIKGANREIKAKSFNNEEIKTGASIKVMEVLEDHVLVLPS